MATFCRFRAGAATESKEAPATKSKEVRPTSGRYGASPARSPHTLRAGYRPCWFRAGRARKFLGNDPAGSFNYSGTITLTSSLPKLLTALNDAETVMNGNIERQAVWTVECGDLADEVGQVNRLGVGVHDEVDEAECLQVGPGSWPWHL
jgi:hypothetical protein